MLANSTSQRPAQLLELKYCKQPQYDPRSSCEFRYAATSRLGYLSSCRLKLIRFGRDCSSIEYECQLQATDLQYFKAGESFASQTQSEIRSDTHLLYFCKCPAFLA